MNVIKITRRIKAERPGTAVIALTIYDSEMYAVETLCVGAARCLVKESARDLQCHAVNTVEDGIIMISSSLLRQAIEGLLREPRRVEEGQVDPQIVEQLTTRNMDVLRLMAQGQTNREIARELNLAEATVKKHIQSIIGKLGGHNRTHAAIVAERRGLLE